MRYKNEKECIRKIRAVSQRSFSKGLILCDLYYRDGMVDIMYRDPLKQSHRAGRRDWIYVGAIARNDIKAEELEYMITQKLDEIENPWRYQKVKTFILFERKKKWMEIPEDIWDRKTSTLFHIIPELVSGKTSTQAAVDIASAEAKARQIFSRYPEKKQIVVKVEGYTILVRGHGYY